MDTCPECRTALPPVVDKALVRENAILKLHLETAEKKLEELGYEKEYIKYDKPCLETVWTKSNDN